MAIAVKLSAFEGPMDLLLHLIDINKIDIYDIPIALLTDQYMEYLNSCEQQDLEGMSEFLVMASTLLDIKCRMLLPREVNEAGQEEDPREELVLQLVEYKVYKYMADELRDRMADAEKAFYHEPRMPREVLSYRPDVEPEELLNGMTLDKLNDIFQMVLKKQEDKIDPIRSTFGKIEKEEVSMADRMTYVHRKLIEKRHVKFSELLSENRTKFRTIVTFLAILELIRTGKARAVQDQAFADIELESLDEEGTRVEAYEEIRE